MPQRQGQGPGRVVGQTQEPGQSPGSSGIGPISPELIRQCRGKLIQVRTDLINRQRESRLDLSNDDKGGDEADQTVRVLQEAEFLSMQDRIRSHLMEVDQALARIEQGTFGICEETEEPIEPERLLAIPWTRLSIEGAEIRESVDRRYAKAGV